MVTETQKAALTPDRKVTVFGKKVDADFRKGALPERWFREPHPAATVTRAGSAKGSETVDGGLILVFGYARGGTVTRLKRPTLILIPRAPVADPPNDQRSFPNAEYLRWDLDEDQKVMEFDADESEIAAALGLGPAGQDDTGAGGFTLRGADGKLYYVPEDLDGFVVLEEADRSALMLAPGIDREDLKVRELDGAVGGGVKPRAMMQSRAMMQGRQVQARAMMQANLRSRGHRGDDD